MQKASKKLMFGPKLANTLHYASPLILTGLATAITFKANIFNMGGNNNGERGRGDAAFAGSAILKLHEDVPAMKAMIRRFRNTVKYKFGFEGGFYGRREAIQTGGICHQKLQRKDLGRL